MKHIKKVIFVLLVVMVLVVIQFFIGSIDNADYDDLGLLDQLKEVADSENGYIRLAYTQAENFQLFDVDDDSSETILKHIRHEVWDEGFVAKKMIEEVEHMNSAISSLSYPDFKFPLSTDISEIPNYLPLIDISRLIIIRSMHDAKNGRLDTSIQYATYAAEMSQKIKSESNNSLISHMIGLVMQYEVLIWLHRLTVDYELNGVQYKGLLTTFDYFLSFHEDTFPHVFAGEFIFARNMIDTIIDRPLKERWQDYRDDQDWWSTDLDNDFGFDEETTKKKLFDLLLVLFPKYYVHRNQILSDFSKSYASLSKAAQSYCHDLNGAQEESGSIEWRDLIKPNAYRQLNNTSVFKDYYTRRCMGHAHIESIKAVAAIMAYKHDHGDIPNNLSALVPEYLPSAPIDPFDGKDLKYSFSKGYLYSVGANFSDDGGAIDAYFVKRCTYHKLCANNPTFPIFSALTLKEESTPATEDVDCERIQE